MQGLQLITSILDRGLITEDKLRIARKDSRKSGQPLEDSLLAKGFITQSMLRDTRSQVGGHDSVSLQAISADPRALELVNRSVARDWCVFPMAYDASASLLTLAMVSASDIVMLDRLKQILPESVGTVIKLASKNDIMLAIDQHYGVELPINDLLDELEAGDVEDTLLPDMSVTGDHPVTRLVDALLSDAVRHKASDIHFDAETQYLHIRYRLDGVLKQIRCLHKDYWSAMLVRLKVLSGMDIAESRAAQDGRMSLSVDGREMDCRLSCFPATNGECIVIRLLDRSAEARSLDELGLSDDTLGKFRRIISKPQGLVLVTGPTGSGKSTTLYAALSHVRDESINIVTMEDPVEYRMSLVRQCSVNSALKFDFASGVRSILRQDPDVILVGETRDQPTCEMVARAMMTGHLVLTTLHTQSALGSFARLQELGMSLSLLSENLLALVAQRLVRKLCSHCKKPRRPTKHELLLIDSSDQVYDATGCQLCHGVGYRGRQAVIDLYLPQASLHQLLAEGASAGKLVLHAREQGHTGLAQVGLTYVERGVTSFAELERVIDLDPLRVT